MNKVGSPAVTAWPRTWLSIAKAEFQTFTYSSNQDVKQWRLTRVWHVINGMFSN